ncbi:MAG: glycosyltransferase [Alphaproteobacteria bacterium]|nr:glycosyltransferase [Alphaproteobacteria bacterium]
MRLCWLIPVRDGGRWLAEAADSVRAQLGDRDEIVIVDDGSADGAPQALRRTPGLRVLHQPPRGIVAALETGRAATNAAYLARLDADDVALPGRVQAQLAALEADPTLGAVGGQARMRRDDGPVPEGMRRYLDWINGLTDLHAALLVESPLLHPAVTMRAAAVAAVGGYRGGDFPEDYDLWLRLARAGWRLGAVPEPVVLLRDRDDRLTRSDPRYRRAAFEALKQEHLARTALRAPRRVAVWGAGRTGRRWLRWLRERGHAVPAVLDLAGRGERQGAPIRPPEALAELEVDHLLFAVGVPGARPAARRRIRTLKPGWQEGREWWPVI